MKNSKINLWLVIALLCLHVGVLAKGGRGSGRSSSSRRSSSRSSSSRSSSSGSSWRSSSSGSSWHSSSSSNHGSSGSSYSPSSSSWGSNSWSSNNPSYSSSRSSYSPSSSSSYSHNSNTASHKSTSDGGIWQSIKNFFSFGSSHSSSTSSSSSQSKNIPIPTSISSNTSPSHSLTSSTGTNQRSSSINVNTLNAHQRFSHAPSETDSRNLNIRRNVTSSASNTLNAPSRLFNGSPALNGTLYNRPSNVHTNISATNVATVQSLYRAPLPTTSDSNHNQGSATSNGRFWSYYNSGLHHTHFYHSGSNWETPTYTRSSEVSSDTTPDSYYTSSGYSSGTGTANYLPSVKENNDEDSGKIRIQKTCTEILNSEGRISELLKKICSPYAGTNSAASTTTTTSTPITGIPTEETTISPTTLTPCEYTSETESPKMVCRKVQQSVLDEHGKLVESIKEICEPDTTSNTTTIPTILCSRPTETTTTAKPVVEPTFSIILPPTPAAR